MNYQSNKKSAFLSAFASILVVVPLVVSGGAYAGLEGLANYLSAGAAFGGPPPRKVQPATHVRVFHVEPQIIYRLDEHRYLELENYESCNSTLFDRGYARVYYYDTQLGIKTQIPANVRNFIGRIINADPTGKNLVFAIAPDEFYASDRGNGPLRATYSTDYGRTFDYAYFGGSSSYTPIEDSEEYTVVITDKALEIYAKMYASGAYLSLLDLTQKDEENKYVKRSRSNAFVPDYPILMDRYECDDTIKGEIELIPIEEYKQKYGDSDD